MKEQIKTAEKEVNEMAISNLSDAKFKTLVIRMLKEFSEDLRSIKKIQSETRGMLIEINNKLQGNNSRVVEAKNQINDLEHKKKQKTIEQEEERIQKSEDSISSLWDNFKYSNIYIIGVAEEEQEQETGNLSENTVKENLPNLAKEIDIKCRKHWESQL